MYLSGVDGTAPIAEVDPDLVTAHASGMRHARIALFGVVIERVVPGLTLLAGKVFVLVLAPHTHPQRHGDVDSERGYVLDSRVDDPLVQRG